MPKSIIKMKRPADRPACEHGNQRICKECLELDETAIKVTNFLVREFWDSWGKRDLLRLMCRAWKLGRLAGKKEERGAV